MPVQNLSQFSALFKKSSHYTSSATSGYHLPQLIKLLQYRWLQVCFPRSFLISSANKHSENELACQQGLTGKRYTFFYSWIKRILDLSNKKIGGKKHLLVCCNKEILCLYPLGNERQGKSFSRTQAQVYWKIWILSNKCPSTRFNLQNTWQCEPQGLRSEELHFIYLYTSTYLAELLNPAYFTLCIPLLHNCLLKQTSLVLTVVQQQQVWWWFTWVANKVCNANYWWILSCHISIYPSILIAILVLS